MLKLLLLLLYSLPTFASTVLYIGDSHSVGPFGWKMDQNLRDAGYEVATFASCGSIGRWWTTGQETPCGYFSRNLLGERVQLSKHATPQLKQLLSEIRPDIVIMQFGGNYQGYQKDFILKDIAQLVQTVRAAGASCFWITSPDTRSYRDKLPWLNELIHRAVDEACPIFKSHLVTKYPAVGGDGIHYWSSWGIPIANYWADLAFEAFQSH